MDQIERDFRAKRAAVIIMLLACLAFGLALLAVTPADAEPGKLEARAYVPLAPDPALVIGGGVAIQWAEVQSDWWLLGEIAPGHGLFADILYMDGKGHFGASASLKPMAEDDGLRVFGSIWWEGGAAWTCGLSQVVSSW